MREIQDYVGQDFLEKKIDEEKKNLFSREIDLWSWETKNENFFF